MKTRILLSGMDVHAQSIVTQTALGDGAPGLRKGRNTPEGRRSLIRFLKSRGADRIVCAYEASSVGFGLYDELREAGIECHVLAPTKMKRSQKDRKNKTDAKDALRILQELRNHVFAGDRLPAVWVPDGETRDHRELVRARLDTGEQITTCKTRIRSLLRRNNVEEPEGVGKAWTVSHKNWLLRLSDGRNEGLGPNTRFALRILLRNLKFLEREAKELEKVIAFLAEEKRYRSSSRALRKMTGIGLLSAMVFLTELGDLSQFPNRRKLASYLGLVPSSFKSGEEADRKGHITREGPPGSVRS